MKRITLTPRFSGSHADRQSSSQAGRPAIAAESLRLDALIRFDTDQIARQIIQVGGVPAALSDVFEIAIAPDDGEPEGRLDLIGDCGHINGLGHQHRRGRIHVEGDIGTHLGACMTGGRITVNGNAGDYLAAPMGSRGIGINGGEVFVNGNAGHFAGHRMRRGELQIAGDVGDAVASWQVAGTITVGGRTGRHVAYGMRRGTLILSSPPDLPDDRFTQPIRLRTPFAGILQRRDSDRRGEMADCHGSDFTGTWTVRRGDRGINGIGEIWIGDQ